MEIHIYLQKEDWGTYQSYIEKKLPKQANTWMNSVWVSILIWTVVTVIFLTIFKNFSYFHWPTATLATIFFILVSALFFFNMFRMRKAFEPLENGIFCGKHKFTFTQEGIVTEGKGYKCHHSWEIIKKIERTSGMILIYLDTVYAYVFPEPKLENPDELYNYISEQYSNVTRSDTDKTKAK